MVLIAVVAGVAIWWTGRTPPRRVNVVIVSIDTLSARVVASMRTLSKLAVRGTAFTNARTVAPLTLPAHATLLTGLEPPAHGIRDNTAAPLPPPGERPFSTLAEEFKDAGYATAAFVAASVLDRRFRLDAGFDEYRQARSPEPGRPSFFSLDAEEQVKRFRAWMGQRPADRPFFAWVHLWEPHAPYRPYAGDEYGDKTEAHDPAEVRYLGEVRRADAALAAILAAVDLETTVVVVTSDHGEALGAHGEKTHGLLCYGATMDIPLVLAGPGVPPGTRDVACGIVDVAPTVRRLAGLSVRAGDGRDLFDDGPRVVCGESLYAHRRYRWAQWSVATDGRFSLLSGGPRLELFDRSADSGETHPLDAPTTHEAYARLDQALLAYRARRRDRAGGDPLASAPVYYGAMVVAQGDFVKPAENRALADVRARQPDVEIISRAEAAIAMRVAAADLAPLAALVKRDPANPAARLAYGRALLFLEQRADAAAGQLEEAVRLGFETAAMWRLLEQAYELAGRPEDAARAAAKASGAR